MEEMPEVKYGVTAGNIRSITGEITVVLEPDHSCRKAVDSAIFARVYKIISWEVGQNLAVFKDPIGFEVGDDELKLGLEMARCEVEWNYDVIDVMEEICGEPAGGEDNGRDGVIYLAGKVAGVCGSQQCNLSHLVHTHTICFPGIWANCMLLVG